MVTACLCWGPVSRSRQGHPRAPSDGSKWNTASDWLTALVGRGWDAGCGERDLLRAVGVVFLCHLGGTGARFKVELLSLIETTFDPSF